MASVEKFPMLAEGYEKLSAQLAAFKAEGFTPSTNASRRDST